MHKGKLHKYSKDVYIELECFIKPVKRGILFNTLKKLDMLQWYTKSFDRKAFDDFVKNHWFCYVRLVTSDPDTQSIYMGEIAKLNRTLFLYRGEEYKYLITKGMYSPNLKIGQYTLKDLYDSR